MTRSPCAKCEHVSRSKNHPDCVDCSSRRAYVRALGAMTHNVPLGLADMTRAAPEIPPAVVVREKIFAMKGGSEEFKIAMQRSGREKRIFHKDGKKHCPMCKKWKETWEFHKNNAACDGLQTYCKACLSEKQKASRMKNRPRARGMNPRKKARARAGHMICANCGKQKRLDAFEIENPDTGNRYTWCRACLGEYSERMEKKRANRRAEAAA